MDTKKTTLSVCLITSLLVGCGGSDSSVPEPAKTAMVTFSIADAPVDSAKEVNVSYLSLTLKRDGQDDIDIPFVNENGVEEVQKINLLDYQNGDSLVVLSNIELPVGTYQELIINTADCPQNQNGATDACYVVEDDDAILPLKTPSNKLKLGSFSISTEGVQAYTIDFNLRKSLVSTANGQSYNLKPHGVTIIDSTTVGAIKGTVDPNLFSAGTCAADMGNVVYLYQAPLELDSVLGDEFDPDIDSSVPSNVIAPYASKMITLSNTANEYVYSFNHLPSGDYLVAFSCSANDDDPEKYDAILIADPTEQTHSVTLQQGELATVNFVEII